MLGFFLFLGAGKTSSQEQFRQPDGLPHACGWSPFLRGKASTEEKEEERKVRKEVGVWTGPRSLTDLYTHVLCYVHVHLRLLNMFKEYNTASNICG